jgi:two-component sensor histidine kinase
MAERLAMRIKGLAVAYDAMTQPRSGDQDAGAFIEQIVNAYRTERIAVKVTAPQGLTLPGKIAGPLGMLVNEAVCNSLMHAFPSEGGQISVSLRPTEGGRLVLEIADNGTSVEMSAADKPSLGRRLMQLEAQQLGGELYISSQSGGGARVVVDIPQLSQSPTRIQSR